MPTESWSNPIWRQLVFLNCLMVAGVYYSNYVVPESKFGSNLEPQPLSDRKMQTW